MTNLIGADIRGSGKVLKTRLRNLNLKKIIIKYLKVQKSSKTSTGVGKLWAQAQFAPAVFLNKVLLAHIHAHSVKCCLWLLWALVAELQSGCCRGCPRLQSLKYLHVSLLRKAADSSMSTTHDHTSSTDSQQLSIFCYFCFIYLYVCVFSTICK